MKVLLTGANGIVGSILWDGLTGHTITPIDLPEFDVRQYRPLVEAMRGHEAVIHLAWTVHPTKPPQSLAMQNITMTSNVFEAARAAGVRRVIVASSVHADNFYEWDTSLGYLPVDKPATPTSPYGASKVFVESLGAYYAASEGLEVICLRLGAVRPGDVRPDDPFERSVWLRHRDLIKAVQASLVNPLPASRFTCFYVVSDNARRIHDLGNPIGWRPRVRWHTPRIRLEPVLPVGTGSIIGQGVGE